MKRYTNRPPTRHSAVRSLPPLLALASLGWAIHSAEAQTTQVVYDVADSFVLNPGPGNLAAYPDAASQNFGALNSRSVAAAAAHPGGDPANPAKGEFVSLLRFDLSYTVSQLDAAYGANNWSISAVSLTLNTSSSVGNTLFNTPGGSGRFNIGWMSYDGGWTQGTGYTSPASSNGITYNGLQGILGATPATLLATCSYEARGTLIPATFSIGTGNESFMAALRSGASVSLLLTPADDQVAFNFTSLAYGGGKNPALYSPALTLSVVPEPATWTLMALGLAGWAARRDRRRA